MIEAKKINLKEKIPCNSCFSKRNIYEVKMGARDNNKIGFYLCHVCVDDLLEQLCRKPIT